MGPELMQWLQQWYADHCDGDWEHGSGVEIGTLDNPGWRLCVNLAGTELADSSFPRLEAERTEADWLHCWVAEGKFQGACGPHNLLKMLDVFRHWADTEKRTKVDMGEYEKHQKTVYESLKKLS